MGLQTKTIGRMPTDHGPYDPELAYGKKFQCELFGCVWESLHDNNNTAPAVWDGGDIITPNLVDWKKASGDYNAWLINQDKPASTGTTGDHPYNGMGKVVLKKHMVNGVNVLTEDAFYTDGSISGQPLENTIFVIKYDFVLGEDITIPANCVLDFDGGSISGDGTNKNTITGNNTQIIAPKTSIFTGIVIAGTWNVPYITSAWFSDAQNENVLKQAINLTNGEIYNTLVIEAGNYAVKPTETESALLLNSNTKVVLVGNLVVSKTDLLDYRIISLGKGSSGAINIIITGTGSIIGEALLRPEFLENPVFTSAHIFGCSNPKNVIIENITITNSIGTCLALSGNMANCIVRNVKMLDSWWYGISLARSKNIDIENCLFSGLYAGGIDIEPQSGTYVRNVTVYGCEFTNCRKGISITDINAADSVKRININNCWIHDPWLIEGDSNQSCIRLRGAIEEFRMTNSRVEAGSIKALYIMCMTSVDDNVIDRRDMCGGIVIDNCTLETSRSGYGIEVFWPYVEILNTKISTKSFDINTSYADALPSGYSGPKTTEKFKTLIKNCNIEIIGAFTTIAGNNIIFENNTIAVKNTSGNNLVRSCVFINNNFVLYGTELRCLSTNFSYNRIDVGTGFTADKMLTIYSKSIIEKNRIRSYSYDVQANNLGSLIYIPGGENNISVRDNILYIGSVAGNIKAITSHSNTHGIIISGNSISDPTEGYLVPEDPYDDNVRNNMIGENCGNIDHIGASTFRNNLTTYQKNCIANGFEYYDKTLGKPVYWTGDTTKGDNGWIDAVGNHPNQQV